jgi:hypothetical protein
MTIIVMPEPDKFRQMGKIGRTVCIVTMIDPTLPAARFPIAKGVSEDVSIKQKFCDGSDVCLTRERA